MNTAVLLTFPFADDLTQRKGTEHRLGQIPASVWSFICCLLSPNEAQVKTKKASDRLSQDGADPVILSCSHYYQTHQAKLIKMSRCQPCVHGGTFVRCERWQLLAARHFVIWSVSEKNTLKLLNVTVLRKDSPELYLVNFSHPDSSALWSAVVYGPNCISSSGLWCLQSW